MLDALINKYKDKANDPQLNTKKGNFRLNNQKLNSSIEPNLPSTVPTMNNNINTSSHKLNLSNLFNDSNLTAYNKHQMLRDAVASKQTTNPNQQTSTNFTKTKANTQTKTQPRPNSAPEELDEEKFEEEFSNIIAKNDQILQKYCTLYSTPGSTPTAKNTPLDPNFNPKYHIKPLTSEFLRKKQHRSELTKTTGKDWFNMKATEMTPEVENDLKILQLKHVMDPKRFYKKPDTAGLPRFFQLATLQVPLTLGKKYQLKRNEVKGSLVEEFLEEDLKAEYSTRKFYELQKKKSALGRKKSKMNFFKMRNKNKGKGKGPVAGYVAK